MDVTGSWKNWDEAPLGFIHTRTPHITAEILRLLQGERRGTHEQQPERAWFSPEEDENSDSPLHRQTYTRNLKRRYMSI